VLFAASHGKFRKCAQRLPPILAGALACTSARELTAATFSISFLSSGMVVLALCLQNNIVAKM
jgi:hypothetical protein